ncbi:chemotaxis response regulator protein-glutamate methylesterase [Methylobrevis sp. L22]|uniref:Protein-glutamate methylesterase/protein-glutamine glutaminase n=2 Tax=Methylobrevis albus TaxID=2793297 RepID=A0A931MZC1_9HYPH|nr:chemotaxis response regulator protein-glutamate methylesterase [Methylobrevis albus]MBH0239317.1 chemotaxis response regulator protein-glutamate methylesterase [Methylobrevis albus]
MSANAHASPPGSFQGTSHGPVTDPIRVMVVDDSVVVRGLVGRWIDEDPGLAVVASHRNGKLAVEDITRADPDVVVLDIEMPDMDGLTALPLMLAKKPGLIVLIASTLSRRNAEISLKALSLGAADYIPKPDGNSRLTTSTEFRADLIAKVQSLGARARSRSRRAAAPPVSSRPFTATRTLEAAGMVPAQSAVPAKPKASFTLRSYAPVRPRVLTIGSSTGGPQALNAFFGHVGTAMAQVPVLLTQHMPATFTAILAEHLSKAAGRPAAEGRDGEPVLPGRIYVAPGGRHMIVARQGSETVIRLTDGPPVNFCKPAVDPLFKSVVDIYGSATLGVILTGMGSDGADGVTAIGQAGGNVITQDEETSVVWGMPGAAAHTGMCADVLPLDEVGRKVARILLGSRI